MSGYWNYATQQWVDEPKAEAPVTASVEQPAAPATKEEETMNIEDQTMLQAFFAKLASKVVEASDLAKRVIELEVQISKLQVELIGVQDSLATERANHADTVRQLQDVRTQLDHEQRAVHDLVMERDIVVEERNKAQGERDEAKHAIEEWRNEFFRVQSELNQERERCHVLEERCNAMQSGVNALKTAFATIQSL